MVPLWAILGEVTEPFAELRISAVIVDQLVHEVPTVSATSVTVDTQHFEPPDKVGEGDAAVSHWGDHLSVTVVFAVPNKPKSAAPYKPIK